MAFLTFDFCYPIHLINNYDIVQVGPSDDGYVICREGYTSADGVLKHLETVGDLLKEAANYSDIVEVTIQGPARELEKLKKPLAHLSPQYYPTVPGGFRNKHV